MGEIKKYLQPVEIRYMCDDCGGDVLPTGNLVTSDTLQYEHKCSKCSKQYIFNKTYPYMTNEYRTVASDMFGGNFNSFFKQ